MILYEDTYEREGNDSWLKDSIQLHHDEDGLYIIHKVRWNGWSGNIKENYFIELDEHDIIKSQEKLDKYIEDNNLFEKFYNGKEEGIKIDLKNIFNNL